MTHAEIYAYCLAKPGAYEDHPFGPESTVIKVCGKIFAQLFYLGGVPMTTLNCDAARGLLYRQMYPEHVRRGYHCPPVQQPYFNTVLLDGTVPAGHVRDMIDHAYGRVVGRLTKRERLALAGDAEA